MNPESVTYLMVRRLTLVYPAISPLVLVLWAGDLFVGFVALSRVLTNRPRSSQVPPAKAKEAKKLFKQKCVKCHGSDGSGNTTYGQIIGATNLTDPEWQERVDDKRLVSSIKHGSGQMPAFGEKLTEEQIASLTSYVRTLRK